MTKKMGLMALGLSMVLLSGCGAVDDLVEKYTEEEIEEIIETVPTEEVDFSELNITEIQSKEGSVFVTCLGKEASLDHELYFENENRRICNSSETNTTVNLGVFSESELLIFRLDIMGGDSFYTGNANMNPDNMVHAKSYIDEAGRVLLGFEDLYGGGDMDFNDCLFLVEGAKLVILEP